MGVWRQEINTVVICRILKFNVCFLQFLNKKCFVFSIGLSFPVLIWKESPYDYKALKWSPAFLPTGEHYSGLSAGCFWSLIPSHELILYQQAALQQNTRRRETMTATALLLTLPLPNLLSAEYILMFCQGSFCWNTFEKFWQIARVSGQQEQ